jgi:hypothetical protein
MHASNLLLPILTHVESDVLRAPGRGTHISTSGEGITVVMPVGDSLCQHV